MGNKRFNYFSTVYFKKNRDLELVPGLQLVLYISTICKVVLFLLANFPSFREKEGWGSDISVLSMPAVPTFEPLD
jgi:hypothetical protein